MFIGELFCIVWLFSIGFLLGFFCNFGLLSEYFSFCLSGFVLFLFNDFIGVFRGIILSLF